MSISRRKATEPYPLTEVKGVLSPNVENLASSYSIWVMKTTFSFSQILTNAQLEHTTVIRMPTVAIPKGHSIARATWDILEME